MEPIAATAALPEAAFEDKQDFEHFEDLEHLGCFACNSRMMLVRPLAVTEEFLLLPATARIDDRFVVVPGSWLVYPRRHLTHFLEMPGNWTSSVQQAVRLLGLQSGFGTSDNWGKEAGQTVEHGHTWVIDRTGEEGLPSENLGQSTVLLRMRLGQIVHG